ncbi:efflux RND transporter permease subunit, partial [Roseovarius aestuariivivens]|uniref:efflux RND transporter permease subunit n=1 Tax=Roseovarius aestuariivivens TaxID=1888910 RepID=UPI001081E315
QQRPKQTTTRLWKLRQWPRNLHQPASGKTGAVQSLAGIILNNAIVLIDRIDIEKAAGRRGDAAIVEAAKRRLRPIVMTTVTTILGLLPLILSKDPLFYGMAVVMAGGLAVGTVLTLGFVPVLYSLFFHRRSDPSAERASKAA